MTNLPPSDPLQIMSPDPAWHLLDRYFGGECTPAEVESVERWVAEDEGNVHLLEQVRRVWVEGGMMRAPVDDDAAWRGLHERIGAARGEAAPRRPRRVAPTLTIPQRGGWTRRSLIPIAAALVATVGSAVWWNGRAGQGAGVEEPAREFVTTRGQRAELMLVDGTRVWLSVDSRLRVPQGYGARARDVELEGEAYFIVRHDAKRPFRVHTHGAVSEDLGTEFSVRAYPDDADAATVVVASGRVALRAVAGDVAEPGAELARGQLGRLDRAGRVTVTDSVDLAGLLGWREGRLEFEERPLAEVLREMERWYDLEIALDDSLLAPVPVTASLTGQAADQALSLIASALDARHEREGRQVRITSRTAPR